MASDNQPVDSARNDSEGVANYRPNTQVQLDSFFERYAKELRSAGSSQAPTGHLLELATHYAGRDNSDDLVQSLLTRVVMVNNFGEGAEHGLIAHCTRWIRNLARGLQRANSRYSNKLRRYADRIPLRFQQPDWQIILNEWYAVGHGVFLSLDDHERKQVLRMIATARRRRCRRASRHAPTASYKQTYRLRSKVRSRLAAAGMELPRWCQAPRRQRTRKSGLT